MEFEWTPQMQVDGGQIDSDHQQLIRLANRLFSFEHPNQEAEEIKLVIRELYEYVKIHFGREAGLMSRIKFPDRKDHLEKHAIIVSQMNQQLTSSHHMGEILGNFKVLMQQWILDHIMEEDMKIKRYLASKQSSTSLKGSQ